MTTSLRAGDRVRYTGSYTPRLFGETGTVRDPDGYQPYITWDNPGASPDGVLLENLTKIEDFAVGDLYEVTVDGPRCTDARGGLIGPRGSHQAGDHVRIVSCEFINEHEVRTRKVSSGLEWTIAKSQLRKVREATPVAASASDPNSRVASIANVWVEGNELQFTATASKSGGMYQVGCKSLNSRELEPYLLHEEDGRYGTVEITVMGTVRQYGSGRLCITTANEGVVINQEEFTAYARDVRLLSTAAERTRYAARS